MARSRDYDDYLAKLGSAKFKSLLPAQRCVLREYASAFTKLRDVGIELPTGGGKTLIALLAAGAWIDEGRKVVVLSANKTLARQMDVEAKLLGLPVAYMEGRGEDIPIRSRRAYQRAQAIGIMNYWVYFNQNPVVDPADLLVMDDAHLAEHCLDSLYSIRVDRYEHEDLFVALAEELLARFPDYAVLRDALADDAPPSATAELLAFIDQVAVADRVREILDAHVEEGTDLWFRWRRLRSKVEQANLYVSRDALWLRPYVYPLASNEHYARPEQVLYMSATIGDTGDLARRLGTRPITKIPVPAEHADRTAGRRLVVMNRTSDESDIPARMAVALLDALKVHPKSLWLCNSEREAKHIRDVVLAWLAKHGHAGHPAWILTSLGDEIDQFRAAPAGHLFVAGRFDGMDFKGNECRVVVVTTLPRAINLQEEFQSAFLRDASFVRRRLNHRIVQALGRCTRSDDDFGVYFLADQRFANHFSREANRDGIPTHIQIEIDLAQDLAEEDVGRLASLVANFMRGSFDEYDRLIKGVSALAPPPRSVASPPDTSADEVNGWTALYDSENYTAAAVRFEKAWDAARSAGLHEVAALHGWHRAKALYLEAMRGDEVARRASLATLDDALRQGGASSWFNRMRASLHRARREDVLAAEVANQEYAEALIRGFDDHLEKLGKRGPKFDRFVSKLSECLDSTSHAQYQEGLELLGRLLAYAASRPQHGGATDCRWRGEFGNAREVITWEAKIEHAPSGRITLKDLGQGHGQHARATTEYASRGYTIRPTLVTHLDQLEVDAVSSVGALKLLRKEAVRALWDRVRTLFVQYRGRWDLDDVLVRQAAAAELRPAIPNTGWLVRALDSGSPWVAPDMILAEWGATMRST